MATSTLDTTRRKPRHGKIFGALIGSAMEVFDWSKCQIGG